MNHNNWYSIYAGMVAIYVNFLVHGNWPRSTIFGLPRKVMATISLRFIPPLYVDTRWSATCRKWLWVIFTVHGPKANLHYAAAHQKGVDWFLHVEWLQVLLSSVQISSCVPELLDHPIVHFASICNMLLDHMIK